MSFCLYGQKFQLYGSVGVGSYQYNDLKTFFEEQRAKMQVDAKVVNNFPAYVTFSGGARVKLKTISCGLEFSYGSTGGRIAYSDYSGYLLEDMVVNQYSFALTPSYQFFEKGPFKLSVGLDLRLVQHDLRLQYLQLVGTTKVADDRAKYKALTPAFRPRIQFEWQLIKHLSLLASAGYEYQVPVNNKSTDSQHTALTAGSRTATVSGGGLRADIGVGYNF